jgi:hypothetical protein
VTTETEQCCEDGCEYDAMYDSPARWCDWHWHMWFAFGDEVLAEELMRISRAFWREDDVRIRGRQRQVMKPISVVRQGEL